MRVWIPLAINYFEEKKYTQGNESRAKGIEPYQKAIHLNPGFRVVAGKRS